MAKYINHRSKLGDLFKKDFISEDMDERLVKEKLSNLFIEIMQSQYIRTIFKIL